MERARILVVDDDEGVLMIAERELASHGYDVEVVLGAGDALGLVEEGRFDLVFTDLLLPGMDGVKLCAEIKKRWPQTEVVLMSAYSEEISKHEQDFIRAGGRDKLLRKPLRPGELPFIAKKVLSEVKIHSS